MWPTLSRQIFKAGGKLKGQPSRWMNHVTQSVEFHPPSIHTNTQSSKRSTGILNIYEDISVLFYLFKRKK